MTSSGLPRTVARMVGSGANVPDRWVPWRIPATTLGPFMRSYLAYAVPETPASIVGIDWSKSE